MHHVDRNTASYIDKIDKLGHNIFITARGKNTTKNRRGGIFRVILT
jgi:hypothetical protein